MDSGKQKLSAAAETVLRTLSRQERRVIRKEHPFRDNRDDLIRKLRAQGVEGKTLKEISGLSRTSIARISRYRLTPLEKRQLAMLRREVRRHRPLLKMLLKIADS